MLGKRLAAQRLARHQEERDERRSDEGDRDCPADLLEHERRGRQGGVVGRPGEGELVDGGGSEERRHRRAPRERGSPHEPARPQQERASDASPPENEHDEQKALRHQGDRLVCGSYLGVAALEGLGHPYEVRQLAGAASGHDDAQAEAPGTQLPIGALVDEHVVDPSARLRLLGRLGELIRAEVDAPLPGGGLGHDARRFRGEVAVARIALWQQEAEAVRLAPRREADEALLDAPLGETTHPPLVRLVDALGREPREGLQATALQLDEGLHQGVGETERGRGTIVGRAPPVPDRE
jgi:hypothetical protein